MNAAYLTPAITLFNEDGTLDLASQESSVFIFSFLIDNDRIPSINRIINHRGLVRR